jgi:hypothetical protein
VIGPFADLLHLDLGGEPRHGLLVARQIWASVGQQLACIWPRANCGQGVAHVDRDAWVPPVFPEEHCGEPIWSMPYADRASRGGLAHQLPLHEADTLQLFDVALDKDAVS